MQGDRNAEPPSSLTDEDAARGSNLAVENARRLYADARLLLTNRRYASAVALAILAIEESGKVPILLDIASTQDAEMLRRFWRDYRSHTSKNAHWVLPFGEDFGAKTPEALFDLYESGRHRQLLDEMKQRSIYTDRGAEGGWEHPDKSVPPEFAKYFVERAQMAVASWKALSPAQVAQYREVVGPRQEQAAREYEDARRRFTDEARRRGFKVPARYDDFVASQTGWAPELIALRAEMLDPIADSWRQQFTAALGLFVRGSSKT